MRVVRPRPSNSSTECVAIRAANNRQMCPPCPSRFLLLRIGSDADRQVPLSKCSDNLDTPYPETIRESAVVESVDSRNAAFSRRNDAAPTHMT